MKRISGINDAIPMLEFGNFQIPMGKDNSQITDATFKNLMVRSFGRFACQDGEKAMNILALGVKLSAVTGDVWEYNETENNADAVIKEVINMNQMQLPATVQGFLYEKVKHAESFGK